MSEDRRAALRAAALALDVDVVAERPVPAGTDKERLGRLARFILNGEGASGSWDISLALVDDDQMRDLHHRFMQIDETTDVMTFPREDDAGGRGGDIAVSVERAAEQGADVGQSAAREVEFLLVHGLLHLTGWDDATAAERDRMLARQTDLLAEFDRRDGPVPAAVQPDGRAGVAASTARRRTSAAWRAARR